MGEGRRYHAGIDGLRGVAVVLVLVFHGGLGWLPGGFLGVSVFFTLSGYLITGLLLDEIEANGRVSFRRFWGRRLRRLAPAGLACLAVVAAWGARLAGGAATSVRADVLAALGYVANWRFVWSHHSYADLFAAPSPVQHFWSLAIEEQCYVVLPLLVGLVAWLGGRRRALAATMAALLVGSVLLSNLLVDPDRVYYGTDTRAAELLVGGLMACAFGRRLADVRAATRATRVASWLGLVALGAVVLASARTGQGDAWLYSGGLAAFAVLSALAVAGAVVPGPAKALLTRRPLVAIGTVSYGLYLYHWPLFVWLTPARLGFGGVGRFVLLLALTSGAAVLSFAYLEQPIRSRTALRRPAIGAAAFTGGVVVVLLVTALVPLPGPSIAAGLDGAGGPVLLATTTTTTAHGAATVPVADAVTTTTMPPLPVVLVLGSDAAFAGSVRDVLAADVRVVDRTDASCPIYRTDAAAGAPAGSSGCPDFRTSWVTAVAQVHPDAVVVAVGDAERGPYTLGGAAATAMVRRDETVAALRLAGGFDAPAFVHDSANDLGDDVADAVWAVAASPTAGIGPLSTAEDVRAIAVAARAHRVGAGPVRPPRVLVVGDSTAQSVAQGLSDGADGRLEVVAAGVIGCPVVDTVEVRPRTKEVRGTAYCPTVRGDWPVWIDAYDPDVVLLVAGAAEQWPQRYPDDPAWYAPGSPGYLTHHEEVLGSILDVLAAHGLPLLTLEPPTIDVGSDGLGGDEPSRAAWASVLRAWDRTWLPVTVLPYAAFWLDPHSPEGRAQRPDGVHPDHAVIELLARERLVPALLEAALRSRAEMRAAGCLVDGEDGPRLDLPACRA